MRWLAIAVLAGSALAGGAFAAQPPKIKPLRVIECGTGPEERPTVVTGVTITPDGRMIAAATDDHTVRVWDATSGELHSTLKGHADWVHAVVLSNDGTALGSGSADRSLCMWNMATQQPVFQIPACKHAIAAVSMHPNNQQLAVVGFGKELEIVNASSGVAAQTLDGPCLDIRTVAFAPQGDRMAAAGRNGKIRVWNVQTGASRPDIETGGRRIRALAFSPDGARIAAAGNSPAVNIYDAATGELVMSLAARPAKVFALVFLDSQHLATGGSDNRVTIWDLDSKEPDSQLVGHTGTVAALSCDATGRTLVSGSYDTTLRIWNLTDRANSSTAWRKPATTR